MAAVAARSVLVRLVAGGVAPPRLAAAGSLGSLVAPSLPSCVVALAATGAVRHATSKAGGSTKNGRDSQPKYLGVKAYGGHFVEPGNVIVRQRGAKYGVVQSTATVGVGKDWTLYALQPGYVKFWYHTMQRKYYVEVVKSPPTAGEVEKYPIVRVRDWELPELLKVPATTPIAPPARPRLLAYLSAIHPARLRAVLPPGVPAIGGVEKEVWAAVAASSSRAASAAVVGTPAPAAAAAAAAAAT